MQKVGIVGYGCYVPIYRIKPEEIARVWGEDGERIKKSLNIEQKAVPDLDEDSATMAVEAAKNALVMAQIDSQNIDAIYVGSESHPYAVKPTASIVAEAIKATADLTAADLEFACKAGTAAIQISMGLVLADMAQYALAIGSDTAQGKPSDALEYSAGAGAAAFIIGKNNLVAEIEATYSFTTDTPDFWRRQHAEFPSHGGRFTGEPAYFKHILSATGGLFEKYGYRADDFDYFVFHQPNGKFPLEAAAKLGLEPKKVLPSLVTPKIGNTYSAASLIGLCAVLDKAKAGEKILLTSFGSGAGSDSFAITVTDKIEQARQRVKKNFEFYNKREVFIDYATYAKLKRKIKTL
ncbi:MAG: hydroxymethylglutaryl-CoA synthase [Candidatus Micrarchaeota archaeon]|nr:hydroxymethylglutaryl-CoA synthase [Candidatus Micrarchaeota archaeon]